MQFTKHFVTISYMQIIEISFVYKIIHRMSPLSSGQYAPCVTATFSPILKESFIEFSAFKYRKTGDAMAIFQPLESCHLWREYGCLNRNTLEYLSYLDTKGMFSLSSHERAERHRMSACNNSLYFKHFALLNIYIWVTIDYGATNPPLICQGENNIKVVPTQWYT